MKKLLIIAAVSFFSVSLFAGNPGDINEKAKQSFKETFPNVKNAEWFDNGNTNLVRFVSDGIDNRIDYNNDGEIVSTTRYYEGKYLPAFIKSRLLKKFRDKKIHLVTELTSQSGMEYHITMYDDKKWIVVKATPNGLMDVYKKYNKQ